MRGPVRRKTLIAAGCLAAVIGAGLLFLLRPAGDVLPASGHDAPADAVEARLAVAWSRVPLLSRTHWEGSQVAGVIPLCQPLPHPGSRASVFSATRDEGGDYLVAYERGGALVGAVNWHPDLPLGFDSAGGRFSYEVDAAEQLLRADLRRSPDAIRYVAAGNGFWVVGRVGERERGVFVNYQGLWDCWPDMNRAYSGAAVLRYLQHIEDHHHSPGGCSDDPRSWE
jgi:hypothetical protein